MPEKLHELQRLWLIEATRYNVLPLDDDLAERLNPDTAGRPQLIKGNSQILFGSMGRLIENSVINIKNKSHSVTAEIVVPATGAEGVIIAQGGNHWWLEPLRERWQAQILLQLARHPPVLRRISHRADPAGDTPGAHGVCVRRWWPGQGRHRDLYVDGKKVGEGRVAATAAMVFSADDDCDVGVDTGSPVSPDYGSRGNEFSGQVKGVQIAIAKDAVAPDHLVSPEEAVRIAMARQ